MRLPFPELSPDHQRVLDALWRGRDELGHWPPSREWVRFHAGVAEKALEEASQRGLIRDREADVGVRPTALGLAYVDDPRAPRALELFAQLFDQARARYRPGLHRVEWATVASELGLGPDDEEAASTFGPDLDIVVRTKDGLALCADERRASSSLEAALFALAHKHERTEQVFGEAPFGVRLRSLEVAGFRALSQLRLPVAPLTVLVGVNGAGKSTVLDALAFIAGAARDGLSAALAAEAGFQRLRTRGSTGPVAVGIELAVDLGDGPRPAEYRVELGALRDGEGERPIIEHELLAVKREGRMEPLVDRRRAVAKVRAADGGLEERFVPVSELVLAQISDEHRYPVAYGIRQALARTVLVDRDPGLEPRFEYEVVGADRARRRAVTPLRALLHEAVPDRATAARLAEALRAFVPSVADVVREPRTGELAEIHLVEEGSSEPARFDELSAGVRQMLLLVALYVHPSPPSLVLLEEPDAALHAGAIPALRDLLRALARRTTVIATSHRADFVRELDASEEVRVLDRESGRPRVSSLADAKAERRWLRAFDPDEALARFGRERT